MPVAIRVRPWPDPVLDVLGHDPRSWYAETFWLPTLGPTALLLMRHLADRFEQAPEGVDLPIADTAAALGLGPRDSQNSPLMKSLGRLHQFELACTDQEAKTISVRRSLPPVQRRHVRRLPALLQARHAEWVAGHTNSPIELARRRARRVAITLVAEGESIGTVERALHNGGFHPALAHEAVRWARDRQLELDDDTDLSPDPPAAAASAPADFPDQASLPAPVPRR
jgi:hypothetical protein